MIVVAMCAEPVGCGCHAHRTNCLRSRNCPLYGVKMAALLTSFALKSRDIALQQTVV